METRTLDVAGTGEGALSVARRPSVPAYRAVAKLESAIEHALWGSRLAVLVAVVASLLASFGMFFVVATDVMHVLRDFATYPLSAGHAATEGARSLIIGHVVEIIDGSLLATVLLIFTFGLYDLFISKIHVASRSELGPRLLFIPDLDELKSRLGKVVLLILIVKVFQHAIALQLDESTTQL